MRFRFSKWARISALQCVVTWVVSSPFFGSQVSTPLIAPTMEQATRSSWFTRLYFSENLEEIEIAQSKTERMSLSLASGVFSLCSASFSCLDKESL